MHGLATRTKVKLMVEDGISGAAAARRAGVSARTVRRWLKSGQLGRAEGGGEVRYKRRKRRPHKLDRFKPLIVERLKEYGELSAVRLFTEIRELGYEGGYGRVRDFVGEVRAQLAPAVEEVKRFETPPGRQGQVDFAEFQTSWGKRHALLAVLGFSRMIWVRYYERETMAVLMEGLESAFQEWGGVPRELLFDQMRSVVLSDERGSGGGLVMNARFRQFARHWGFRTRACRPRRAQTKGKVERPIRYLRGNFYYGREFANDADLNERVARWLAETANVRVHGTTKERPLDRFEREERRALLPLAARRFPRIGELVSVAPADRSQLAPVEVEKRSLSVYSEVVA